MSQPSITMKSKMQELNYKAQNCEDIKQDNNSICETNINQYVYHKDDLEISDTEDQTSNDETSNSYKNSQNNSKSQKNDNYNIKTLKYMKRYDNKEIDEYVNNCDNEKVTEYQENVEDLQETNGTIFKSELLKNRLLELEQEISIFRKENTALSMQRKKLHEDYKNLCKEYAQKEKNFEQNKKQVEERLQEEKKN
uniref:Phosphoglycerate mutase family member 5 n=1 Tax=Apis cerana TaxID=7461 RepID=V9IGN6_APICE